MRGFVSKFFRKEAVSEMANDRVVGQKLLDRDLVELRSGSQIHSPNSIRRLYLDLKRAYKRKRSGLAEIWNYNVARAQDLIQDFKARGHGKKKPSWAQPEDRIMRIEKPLNLILQHCKPTQSLTDPQAWIPHPVYASAQRAARKGRGDLVKKMALQFVPA